MKGSSRRDTLRITFLSISSACPESCASSFISDHVHYTPCRHLRIWLLSDGWAPLETHGVPGVSPLAPLPFLPLKQGNRKNGARRNFFTAAQMSSVDFRKQPMLFFAFQDKGDVSRMALAMAYTAAGSLYYLMVIVLLVLPFVKSSTARPTSKKKEAPNTFVNELNVMPGSKTDS